MKKIILYFSTLLLVVLMSVSCNRSGVKDVAQTWLNGFYHMDYDAAKKVSTEDTKSLLSQLQALTSMVNDSTKKEMKKITVVIKDVKEKGDTAKVKYSLSDNPTKSQDLDLVKKDGKWLVMFTKSNQNASTPEEEPATDVDTTGTTASPVDNTTPEDTAKH